MILPHASAIYIAGPMRGYHNFNRAAFDSAEKFLIAAGYKEVFNPVNRDADEHGDELFSDNPDGSILKAEDDHGFSLREALAADSQFICLQADAIFMLEGWEGSKGACAEHALAVALGLDVRYDA